MGSAAKTIAIACPPSAIEGGNRTTAERWAGILRGLGLRVLEEEIWSGSPVDGLVALHAGKSHASIVRFRREHAERPILVCATGTDIYGGDPLPREVAESFELASRIIVLQPRAIAELPLPVRGRARVVFQSVLAPERRPPKAADAFQVCTIAHLRPVKDPLLPATASRTLPAESRIRIVLVGGLHDEAMRGAVEREAATNPRFRWLGRRSHGETLDVLARSHLFVSSSRHEGGSNAVSEALALGLPILATSVAGNLGLLGDDHPGLFPPGDAPALAERMLRAESDPGYLRDLAAASRARAWMTAPELEVESWRSLLAEVFGTR